MALKQEMSFPGLFKNISLLAYGGITKHRPMQGDLLLVPPEKCWFVWPFFQEALALTKLWWQGDPQVYRGICDQNTSDSWISGLVKHGRLIPAQPLLLLGSFDLELVHCARTTVPWHSNLDPFLRHPSGVQTVCSLPAGSLSFTASPPGKRRKAEPGDRGKAEQSWRASGLATTACHRGWSAHVAVGSEAVLEGAAPPLLPS